MKHCPSTEEQFAYADRSVDPELATRIAPHLVECESCRAGVTEMEEIIFLLRSVFSAEATVPDSSIGQPRGADELTRWDVNAPDEISLDDDEKPRRDVETVLEIAASSNDEPTQWSPNDEDPLPIEEALTLLARESEGTDTEVTRRGGRLPSVHVPGYKILKPLQKGGMGAVYLALQESMARKVAIKLLAPSLAADPRYVQRFLREARACARLTHPNIVQVFDVGTAGDRSFLVMEFVDGIDLGRRIASKALSVSEVFSLGIKVAAGLEQAHHEHIIHRDIKPSNILIGRDGSVKLADLGLAKVTDEADGSLTTTGSCLGSPSYMPPEQARNFKDVGPEGDVYALAATLYHGLYGHPPFRGASTLETLQMAMRDPVTFPKNPDVPSDLVKILKISLRKDPRERFADASAFGAALKAVAAGRPPLLPKAKTGSGSGSGLRRHKPSPHRKVSRRQRPAQPSARFRQTYFFVVGAVALGFLIALFSFVGGGGKKRNEGLDQRALDGSGLAENAGGHDLTESPAEDHDNLPGVSSPEHHPLETSSEIDGEESRPKEPAEVSSSTLANRRMEFEARAKNLIDELKASVQKGDVAAVATLSAKLKDLLPNAPSRLLSDAREMVLAVQQRERVDAEYRRERGEVFLAFKENGPQGAADFIEDFANRRPEVEESPAFNLDRTDVEHLAEVKSSVLENLSKRIGDEMTLMSVIQRELTGELREVNGDLIVIGDAAIRYDRIMPSDLAKLSSIPVRRITALSFSEPLIAQAIAGKSAVSDLRLEQISTFVEANATWLLEQAEALGSRGDAEHQYIVLASLSHYRHTRAFQERGPELASSVDQAVKLLGAAGPPINRDLLAEAAFGKIETDPGQLVDHDESQPSGADHDDGDDNQPAQADDDPDQPARVDDDTISDERAVELLSCSLHGHVTALGEGRFEVAYDFSDSEQMADWKLDAPKKDAQLTKYYSWITKINGELHEAEPWSILDVEVPYLFGKGWGRLRWRDKVKMEGEIEVEGRAASLDGHNLAIGLTKSGKTLWAVKYFQPPPLTAYVPAAFKSWADNFRQFDRPRHMIAWEVLYKIEVVQEEIKRKTSGKNEQSLILTYRPDEDGAMVLLSERKRSVRELLEARIENVLSHPRVTIGTFGSYVAFAEIKIRFGVSQDTLKKVEKKVSNDCDD